MRKLLIADDEPGVRALVRMTLEAADYEIFEASDGQEALDLVRTHHPELILLDVEMPKRSGFDVCRAVRAEESISDATIVLLTARTQESDIAEGTEAGADDYFTKPFSPFELMAKVDEVLGGEVRQ